MSPIEKLRRLLEPTGLPGDPASKIRTLSCSPDLYDEVRKMLPKELKQAEVRCAVLLPKGTVLCLDRTGTVTMRMSGQDVVLCQSP